VGMVYMKDLLQGRNAVGVTVLCGWGKTAIQAEIKDATFIYQWKSQIFQFKIEMI